MVNDTTTEVDAWLCEEFRRGRLAAFFALDARGMFPIGTGPEFESNGILFVSLDLNG